MIAIATHAATTTSISRSITSKASINTICLPSRRTSGGIYSVMARYAKQHEVVGSISSTLGESEYGERQRRSIARTSRDAWRTPCRTPHNVHQCAVLRFDGQSCTPCVSTRNATGLPACGLSLGSGSALSANETNERHVCSEGTTCPSRACRILGTSS